MEKYVLCRPRGGLNDILCQIEQCWRYADKSGRTLIIDTPGSSLKGAFCEFFVPLARSCRVRFSLPDTLREILDQSSCYPAGIQNRLSSYTSEKVPGMNHVDVLTKTRLRFDLDRDYEETVLVCEQSGGGMISFDLLRRLRFTEEYATLIGERISRFDSEYVSVHVRNTDYKTNHAALFDAVARSAGEQPILICSDDAAVVKEAGKFFGPSRIFVVSNIPMTDGAPLHVNGTHDSDAQHRQAVADSLVDLIALGSANRFFYTNVKAGYPSGFSMLAAFLCDNKDVIDTLLGRAAGQRADGKRGGAVHVVPMQDRLRKWVPKYVRKLGR